MAKAEKPSIPSVLAFEKKLVPSDAQLFAVSWPTASEVDIYEMIANKTESSLVMALSAKKSLPLKLQEKSVRGTISNRLKNAKEADPAKLDASIENANIQTVDYCALPNDKDTLKLRFTLKVLSGVQMPSACNGQDFQKTYAAAVQAYIDKTQFKELAQRYATNIANARFLWRNRVGAEQIQVVVTHINSTSDKPTVWTFDAKEIGLHDFDSKAVQGLAQVIADSLRGNTEFALLDIEAYSQLGEGQEVYPSEELVTEKGDKSKILYETDGVAALHSQKVGNALRTIDTWYEQDARPIAIEVYGSVTNQGTAYRKPTDKKDFYTLFDQFALGGKLEANDEHYVMAMLVRGGVFGQSSK